MIEIEKRECINKSCCQDNFAVKCEFLFYSSGFDKALEKISNIEKQRNVT